MYYNSDDQFKFNGKNNVLYRSLYTSKCYLKSEKVRHYKCAIINRNILV